MNTKEQINELEQYFKTVSLPQEIRISQCEHVVDVQKFIDAHLLACRNNIGNNTFSAFYARLVTLKKIISGEIPEPQYYQHRGFIDAHNAK